MLWSILTNRELSMFAAIDLGSNSFRLHVGAFDGRAMRVIRSARDPVRLGGGIDQLGNLTDEAIASAISSLNQFRELLATYSLDAVRAVATNTLRIAKNAQAFLPKAEAALGYPIEIISGREEASLIYAGVASAIAIPCERRIVVDIGGGSTEVVLGEGNTVERADSVAIGTIDQSRKFFPDGRIDPVAFETAIRAARSVLLDSDLLRYPLYWAKSYGSSGTIRAIASVIARNAIGDGVVSRRSLEELKAYFLRSGHLNRIRIPGLRADRVPAVVGGVTILLAMADLFGIEELQPVDAGLRMGVMCDMHARLTHRDRREQSVREFLMRFRVDDAHSNHVAQLAAMLYAQLKPGAERYASYLYWSALLHSIGMTVSRTGHHKHAAYLIANGELPGYSSGEQRTMSTLIAAQRGNLEKVKDLLCDLDFAKAVLAMRLAVILSYLCPAVDTRGLRVAMTSLIQLEIPGDWLEGRAELWPRLIKEKDCWRKVGREFSVRVGQPA
jgi:exopolyphosphatase/guanosine-5'-triphosphate,3'-diphosphate pyrophosphatase